MERLTEVENGTAMVKGCGSNCKYGFEYCRKEDWENCKTIDDVIDKLAQYEDLEDNGLLLRLPCKVGNTVYRYVEEKGCVLEYTVWNISMSAYESGGIDIVIEGCAESEDEVEDEFSLSLIDFKNEFFNTKAEAKQKLKETEENQMKSTGIIRRVDDLGRIVIPKETRRILGIKESDPMEFFIDGEDIIIRKYKEESEENQ